MNRARTPGRAVHPRISLHQVAYMDVPTPAFVAAAHATGVRAVTLVTPKFATPADVADTRAALAGAGMRVATLNHLLTRDLERDDGGATAGLDAAIDLAADLGAPALYLLTGGRGGLDWEGAAARFATLLAPCRGRAAARGITLLVENANVFNADIHIAHTLPDTIRLAETAGIGVCIDLHACWAEAGLRGLFAHALPLTGLVQVSDYVPGDRATPCRAVPGDGAIPLARLVGDLLALGYAGPFDLELTGPRIAAEGAAGATARAVRHLSDLLTRQGA